MLKRILDLNASDLTNMTKEDIISSIKGAEGRTIASEIIVVAPPLLWDVSNAELASSFGADILILNMYDVNNPIMEGLPIRQGEDIIREVKRLTGRIIGVNLEPVDVDSQVIGERVNIPNGRLGTIENVEKLISQGGDMVVFTGNPKTGVTNEEIINSIRMCNERFGDKIIIMAGKMHAAGSGDEAGSKIITKDVIKDFIDAGCDIILLPAPGTIPGITVEYLRELIEYVHSLGKLTMTAIGTSQEGADEQTIKNIALYSKMAGTDIHHLGDAGMSIGIANPENIMIYSIAIKGKRHTYRRMARSVNR